MTAPHPSRTVSFDYELSLARTLCSRKEFAQAYAKFEAAYELAEGSKQRPLIEKELRECLEAWKFDVEDTLAIIDQAFIRLEGRL